MDKCPKYPVRAASYWEDPFNVFFCCCKELKIEPPGPTEQQIKIYGQVIDKKQGIIECKDCHKRHLLTFLTNGKVFDIYHIDE